MGTFLCLSRNFCKGDHLRERERGERESVPALLADDQRCFCANKIHSGDRPYKPFTWR